MWVIKNQAMYIGLKSGRFSWTSSPEKAKVFRDLKEAEECLENLDNNEWYICPLQHFFKPESE